MSEKSSLLPTKKKRQLNKWQLFLKDCMPSQDKSLGMTEKVSACGIVYKELKSKNPKKLDEIVENQRLRIKHNH